MEYCKAQPAIDVGFEPHGGALAGGHGWSDAVPKREMPREPPATSLRQQYTTLTESTTGFCMPGNVYYLPSCTY